MRARLVVVLVFMLPVSASIVRGQQECANPVACENALPGSPPEEWDISGYGDSNLQGFATAMSVNNGEIVDFKVDTIASTFDLAIYRLGYYDGLGARLVATQSGLPGGSQPSCLTQSATGLVDCGNWSISASWAVPADAVSGIYVAKLTRAGSSGSHILFVVRSDQGDSDIVMQTADTTWQAYNTYGGKSLYSGGPGTNPSRAYKVSYNRPLITRGTHPEDAFFNAEYPMVRWLEANGYDVSYVAGADTDRMGSIALARHRVFLVAGHDEYWSANQRRNVELARDAGMSAAFFIGNGIFWKTRWESSIAGSSTAYRTLVCYKETHANAKIDPQDPPTWTGTWRDPRFSPPADGGKPENALMGTIFTVNNGGPGSQSWAIEVPQTFANQPFWRNTRIASLPQGGKATLAAGTLDYEWDENLNNGYRPKNLVTLSSTTKSVAQRIMDNGSTYGPGTATHALTLYPNASGNALVFGAGTVQWSWGLDGNHDRGGSTPDLAMQQATANLLYDMGVEPATLRPDLVPGGPPLPDDPPPGTCPCSLWSAATTPGPMENDAAAVELGVKFTADHAGSISALRFYKYAQNSGSHVGHLWTASGQLLGTATFSSETASGWQQAAFPAPIAIAANTTYIASYHTNTGFYALTDSGFSSSVNSPPLRAPADSLSGGNGVYRYGASGVFPNETYQASNYWVDVVFMSADTTAPTVLSKTPANNATGVGVSGTVTATFSEAMTASTVSSTTMLLKGPGNTTVTSTVAYDAANLRATLTPAAALAPGTIYTATVKGGASGVKDAGGNALVSDVIWTFTTAAAPGTCPCSLWSAAATPGPMGNDGAAVELGVKFISDVSGVITGLRFYKYPQNTGTHVGRIWAASGTLLGTVTFSGETASGWQQATFATPVAIAANTTYVASYHTTSGFYAVTAPGFSSSVNSPPLHALADGFSGGNGVYRYGAGGVFPNQTYQASNYWVDVVFMTAGTTDTTAPTVVSTTPANNATGIGTSSTVTATFSEAMTASTVSSTTMLLTGPGNTTVTSTVAYDAATLRATLTPAAALAPGTIYNARVRGGASGVKDAAGNALVSDATWTFTTAVAQGACPCSLWGAAATPGPMEQEASAVELGVKFTSDTSGFITGLRFYKYAQNTGTHVGRVWTASGTLLGTVTFSGETASGWQQATFATPVAIAANTTYVASYHTTTGFYAITSPGFSVAVNNAPLHALADGTSGGNGVYRYGAGGVFPNQTYSASNYWVDVIFTTVAAP